MAVRVVIRLASSAAGATLGGKFFDAVASTGQFYRGLLLVFTIGFIGKRLQIWAGYAWNIAFSKPSP